MFPATRYAAARRRAKAPKRQRGSIELLLAGIACIGLFGAALTLADPREVSSYSPNFSAWDQARHFMAAPNCHAARLVGLAPSVRGQPGYWNEHDRDRDGIACEPIPEWRSRSN